MKLRGGIAHPERQHGALDVDALRQQHLGLPMERQMPGIFGNQHVGDHRLGGQPALDQPLRCRRLNHATRAGPAGIFGTMRDDHAELRRNDVEPLRRLLADHVHCRMAARAVGVFRCNRHVDVRQMGRKRTPMGAALLGALASARGILLVLGRLVGGHGLLDILDRQLQLFRIELLRAAPELRALQLPQEVAQPVHLRQRVVARRDRSVAHCDRSIALRARRRHQRLQRVDIGRKLIRDVVHITTRSDSRDVVAYEARTIQSVEALMMPLTAAQRRGHADATSPGRPSALRAARRTAASHHR